MNGNSKWLPGHTHDWIKFQKSQKSHRRLNFDIVRIPLRCFYANSINNNCHHRTWFNIGLYGKHDIISSQKQFDIHCIYTKSCKNYTRLKILFHHKGRPYCLHMLFIYMFVCLFVWWCLTPLSTIFQLYRGGGNRRTQRKPPTCGKSLTNFIK